MRSFFFSFCAICDRTNWGESKSTSRRLKDRAVGVKCRQNEKTRNCIWKLMSDRARAAREREGRELVIVRYTTVYTHTHTGRCALYGERVRYQAKMALRRCSSNSLGTHTHTYASLTTSKMHIYSAARLSTHAGPHRTIHNCAELKILLDD